MLEFVLALLATATVGALLVPLLRTPRRAAARLDGELALYRDQLDEIERERAAGTIAEADAAAARLEIERRALAAGDQTGPRLSAPQDHTLHRILSPALALAIPLLALGLYLQIGRPGLPASPTIAGTSRPSPTAEPMDVARLVKMAQDRVAAQPDDAGAQSALGEALTLEADGTVTEQAVAAFRKAFALQPDDARAQYYLGLHEAQSGDSRAAIARWRALEARSPADAPYLPMLRAEIARVARAANIEVPPAAMAPPNRTENAIAAVADCDRASPMPPTTASPAPT